MIRYTNNTVKIIHTSQNIAHDFKELVAAGCAY